MQDTVFVHVVYAKRNLHEPVHDLILCKPLAAGTLHAVIEVAAVAIRHDEIQRLPAASFVMYERIVVTVCR